MAPLWGEKSPYDLSFYHRTDALLDTFLRLADPSRCGLRLSTDNLHDTEDPSFQMRVATFQDVHSRDDMSFSSNSHVMINFGAHGRELISSEVALRLARMLCGESPSRFAGSEERSREAITALLRRAVIKLIPVQVPSARRLAEVGEGSCKQRRLNSRQVDVNRNWDVAWAQGDAASRGPRPFSEPETRALARFATEWHPDAFVDVRAGDRYMAMPWASRASGPVDRSDREGMRSTMRAVSAMLRREHPKLMSMGDLPYGPASSLGEEPYKATGTALDYMYSAVGVRRAYMFEVFGASTVYGVAGRGERAIGRLPTSILLQLEQNASTNVAVKAGAMTPVSTVLRKAPTVATPLEPMQLALLSTAEGGGKGMAPGLPTEERPFDCVAFFNPTTRDEYEATVNGWADALLVVINATVASMQ